MGKKGSLWWRESDWLLRGSSAANQILLRHSGPILSFEQRTQSGTVEERSKTDVIPILFLQLQVENIMQF